MPSKPDRLAAALVKAALALHKRRPWERVEPDAPFAVRLGDGERVYAFVMGGDGVERGLCVMRGEGALQRMLELLMADRDEETSVREELLAVAFAPLRDVNAEARRVLDAAGFRGRREVIAPILFAQSAERAARPLNRGEMRVMLEVLRAVLAADERELLDPPPPTFDERDMLELRVVEGGSARSDVEVEAEIVSWPEPVDMSKLVGLPGELGSEPRIDETWIVTWVEAPLGSDVNNAEGGAAELACTVLVLAEDPEEVLAQELLPHSDLVAVSEILADAVEELGLPREIVFCDPTLHEAFATALGGLGVETRLDPERENVRELVELVRDQMASFDPSSFEPEDFEDWKGADFAVCGKFAEIAHERGHDDDRPMRRYLGNRPPSDEAMEELEESGLAAAFALWLVADHRAEPGAPTELERLLEAPDLADWERELLEAHRDAELSVYRVLEQDPEGPWIEVEDVLSGEHHTIDDVALAQCDDLVGMFLPLRLYRVREWTFASIAGPPLPALLVDRALALIEDAGAALDPGGLREYAELTGRWWALFDPHGTPPILENTDGEALAPLSASFRVDDPGAVASALDARPDLRRDDDQGVWVWLRAAGPAGSERKTVLGRIQSIGDHLVLEVNSAERLERAREWLERLPGVHFESSTESSVLEEPPLDDRLPGPPSELSPAEQEELLREALLSHYRAWLDEEIPALGGRTPRAMCATEEGRQRVARLVRTIPDVPGPNGPVRAPREELLAELGIES